MKLNYSKIKSWWNTPVNPGRTSNEYDSKSPSQWDVDGFKSFISDNLTGQDKPHSDIAMFGFPNENLYKYFATNPTGLNGDKQWNKYENFGGAMYDIFTHLKQRFGAKTENKFINTLKEQTGKNNISIEDTGTFYEIFLTNVSNTTPFFRIEIEKIKNEKYRSPSIIQAAIDKIFPNSELNSLDSKSFASPLTAVGKIRDLMSKLREQLYYKQTINFSSMKMESISAMVRRIVKEEMNVSRK